MATVIDKCGTKSPRAPCATDPSVSTENTKVATNVPSVIWVPRSRTKLRSMRGPNCVDASVSATIVMENTRPTTVMTAAAIPIRIWRAASAEPLFTHDGSVRSPLYAARSIVYVTMNSATARNTSTVGMNHNVVRSASRRHAGSLGNGPSGACSLWPCHRAVNPARHGSGSAHGVHWHTPPESTESRADQASRLTSVKS